MASQTVSVLSSPLTLVAEQFDQLCAQGVDTLHSGTALSLAPVLQQQLQKSGSATALPSLNALRQEQLPPGALVRFQGMVVDMRDPEYYAGVYEEIQPDGATRMRTGKFRDALEVPPGCTVRPRSEFTWQRTPIICAPLPGTTEWAAKAIAGPLADATNNDPPAAALAMPARSKRSADEDMDERPAEEDIDDDMAVDEAPKRSRADGTETANSTALAPCMPCEGSDTGINARNPAAAWTRSAALGSAMVKIYDTNTDGSQEVSDLRLNDLIEVYGVLDMGGETDAPEPAMDGISLMVEEERALRPPPSAQPRLHCLYYRKLQMGKSHPLLPPPGTNEENLVAQAARHQMVATRAAVVEAFTSALSGDALSAELLLFSIISRVLTRRGEAPIGKLALNISGCPAALTAGKASPVWSSLLNILRELLPTVYGMPLTLQKLNDSKLIPEKDYEANVLLYGELQLPAGSTLLLDETTLTPGKLTEAGVRNLGALGDLVARQKVAFDFKYFPVDFESDVSMVSVSTAQSVLSNSAALCQVPLAVCPSGAPMPAALSDASFLNAARCYLGFASRCVGLEMPEPVAQALQNDFVNARKANQQISPDDFAHWLTCSRLYAASLLANQIEESHYAYARQLEAERVARLRPAEVCV